MVPVPGSVPFLMHCVADHLAHAHLAINQVRGCDMDRVAIARCRLGFWCGLGLRWGRLCRRLRERSAAYEQQEQCSNEWSDHRDTSFMTNWPISLLFETARGYAEGKEKSTATSLR